MHHESDCSEAMTTYYVGANVIVGPNVAIAPGTVLEASPKSQLIIEQGVCIGAGVVVQAFGGQLILRAGASIGREVLVLGAGTIGPQACIGAESTLINPSIESHHVVPARSLLGDSSRGNDLDALQDQKGSSQNEASAKSTPQSNGIGPPSAPALPNEADAAEQISTSVKQGNTVYGREQVTRLVGILFPHRRAVMSDLDDS